MFNNQLDSISLCVFLDSLNVLQKYIATEPDYSSMIDNIISIDDDIIEIFPDQQSIIPSQSSNHNNQMDINDFEITADDEDDEIPFDQIEWSVKDPFKQKLRPPKLLEFLYLILNNSRYVSYASWLDKTNGLFQIHKPNQVIQLWKKVKIRQTNSLIDFDRFSRCIRYYYTTGLMIPTYKKLTYRFAIKNH